jgi:hypothetical protein
MRMAYSCRFMTGLGEKESLSKYTWQIFADVNYAVPADTFMSATIIDGRLFPKHRPQYID